MKRRLFLIFLVVAFLVGLAQLFWAAPIRDGAPAGQSGDPDQTEEQGVEISRAPVDAPRLSESPQSQSVKSSSLLTQQAKNAWYNGDIPAAMILYEQAIDADPDDPAPYAGYGRLLTLTVGYDRALPLLQRARDLQPGEAQPWLDLATLYERTQRFDESFAAQAEAAELIGADAITRDEQGRFVVVGEVLW